MIIKSILLELSITTRYPFAWASDLEAHVTNYLKENIIGHCIKGSYIMSVNDIKRISDIEIQSGLHSIGVLGVILDAEIALFPKETVIVDMKCIKSVTKSDELKLQKGFCETINIHKLTNKFGSLLTNGNYIPIRLKEVLYKHGEKIVTIAQYERYEPRQIYICLNFTNNSIDETENANTIAEIKRIVEDEGIGNNVNCQQLITKVFGDFDIKSTDVDITSMDSTAMISLLNNKKWLLLPPKFDKLTNIIIRPINADATNVIHYNNMSIVMGHSLEKIRILRQFVNTFNTDALIKAHQALWLSYKEFHKFE